MKTASRESQPDHGSDYDLIELIGMKADFPAEAMEAYGKIYSLYWREMFIIATNVTKDEDSAQDLVADTFNMVYRRASTFSRAKLKKPENIRSSILKWMNVIMQNVFYDNYLDEAYKKPSEVLEESYIIDKKLISKYIEDDYSDFVTELEEIEVDGQTSSADAQVDEGNLAKVRDYLATFSERDRDIVLIYYTYHAPGKHTPGTVLDELEKKWGTTRENIRKVLQKFRNTIKADLQTKLTIRK